MSGAPRDPERKARSPRRDATQRARTAEGVPGGQEKKEEKRGGRSRIRRGGAAVESEAEERGTAERETETEKTSRNPSAREGAQWGGAKESRVERGREDSWEYRGFGRD